MLALHAAASAASSANPALVLIALPTVLMAVFWRNALRILVTIAAVVLTVLLVSGAIAIVHFAHQIR